MSEIIAKSFLQGNFFDSHCTCYPPVRY